ncbi:MAG TPA: alpha/beta hydrolase-fold protein [Flavisolibacter sp.]|nr:alpha/beta hydrolase-fold protein [Flavisolibacter sp.]
MVPHVSILYKEERKLIESHFLKRKITVDFYIPSQISENQDLSLLLINDGQNLPEMNFISIIEQLHCSHKMSPLVYIGIHAGKERKNEYGTAARLDYEGRGKHSKQYQQFILNELIPHIQYELSIKAFSKIATAGFSLGGLSALDIMWNHPTVFSIAGVFSGSLWWRSKSVDEDYDDNRDRIMQQIIKNGAYHPGNRFYFTTGSLDETADRNNNGVIDSIDDTLAVIEELKNLGYSTEYDIRYINYENGKHDIATWAMALPGFLVWAFNASGKIA